MLFGTTTTGFSGFGMGGEAGVAGDEELEVVVVVSRNVRGAPCDR